MNEPVTRLAYGQAVPAFPPVVHSWSSLVTFEQCPWKWFVLKVKKLVNEGQTVEMREGNERHKALELGVRDGISLPEKYKGDEAIVKQIRETPGQKIVEWQFGLTRNWTECGFYDKSQVWVRGKIDVGVVGTKSALLIDYKTGKPKSEVDELGLFAIPAFTRWPTMGSVKTAYLWLGDKKLDPKTYTPGDLPHLKELFGMRFHRIEDALKSGSEKRFPKIPGGLCSWCPVGPQNCEYWRAYKGVPK